MDALTPLRLRLASASGGTLAQRTLAQSRDDSRPASQQEVVGEADGAPLRLPSGILIGLRRVGQARVSTNELMQVVSGIQLLPPEDQALVARTGLRIDLLPVAALEQAVGGGDYLGATSFAPDHSTGRDAPTSVRVAVRGTKGGVEAPREVVQHEIGHVLALLRSQDKTEDAAIAYAKRY